MPCVGVASTGVVCAVAGGDGHIARVQRGFNGGGFALVNGDIHRVNQPFAACGVDVQVFVDADLRSAGVDEVGFQCARSFGFAVLHVGNQEDFSVFSCRRLAWMVPMLALRCSIAGQRPCRS